MNEFGGNWTERKIEILVEYASAYLHIMKNHAHKFGWHCMYFDGFAGSGLIVKGEEENRREIIGAAKRIVAIDEPIPFDSYYFVELNTKNAALLQKQTQLLHPHKKIYISQDDCNKKLHDLADFLASNKKHKVLAYIDPYGMQLEWSAIQAVSKHSVDLWVLVPTGLGANRLLTRDASKITTAWMARLEKFLGLNEKTILNHFYRKETSMTLFGEEEIVKKEEKAIERVAELYTSRLGEIFKHVSKSYVLKNSQGSTMFHYLMVSNNKTAVTIANDIVTKYNRL